MDKMVFRVEFLSDIVLPASSNTQGNSSKLDFIPGSNFLGMVASGGGYESFKDPFLIFHSSKVRFLDATVLFGDKETFKIPFSFYHEKLDNNKIVNYHIEGFSDFKQAKQIRKGYMTDEFELVELDYDYQQKSAYDKKKRRSKDQSMYGYSSLKEGTKWQFEVEFDDDISDEDKQKIKNSLVGIKRLGKSKSSQYGRVKIEFVKSEDIKKEKVSDQDSYYYLYLQSRVALFDENNNPTYDIRYICQDLTEDQTVYDKTQIRTSSFTPYNSAMKTKCYERVVIEKGSVVVLKNLTPKQIEELQSGVGGYKSEGFGKVRINPHFLTKSGVFSLKKQKDQGDDEIFLYTKEIKKDFDDPILDALAKKHNKKLKEFELSKSVDKFIKDNKTLYSEAMNSQWGAIRALCNESDDTNIYDKVEKFITKGVAKTKWEGSKADRLLNAIKKQDQKVAFVKLLAMRMPKVTKKTGELS